MTKVYFVGAGPGDPELLTLKGRKLIETAEVIIYAGSLVNPALLAGCRATVYDSAAMDLDAIIETMRQAVAAGSRVVRLHTGDLSFYSAVTEQIHRLRELGIAYEIVPGVSSLAAGAALLGQELTVPEVSQSVVVTRRAGRTPVPAAESIRSFAAHGATMVIFLSVGMIRELATDLLAGGYPEDTPVAVVEKASWPGERLVRGTLADIAARVEEAGITRTALVYVGPALAASVRKPGAVSKLYDKDFTHGFRQ